VIRVRARDLAEPYPSIALDATALDAARMLGEHVLPGLIVLGDDGLPWTVLPGSQVLRFVIPRYVQDDPALARVYEEDWSDQLDRSLSGKTVRDVLPRKQDATHIPQVAPDATTMEVAAVMVRMHSPIVAVVDGSDVLGAISVRGLLACITEGGTKPQ
jgi:CBS domain-containing protein